MFQYNCKILNVIDGDTLDIQVDLGFDIQLKERIRLLGVNTPEVFGKKSLTEGIEGKSASTITKEWVDSHKGGRFVYESRKYNARDKYGRSLGHIFWTDGTVSESLNETLIKKGWAA